MTPPEHLFTGISLAHIFYGIQTFLPSKKFNYFLLMISLGIAAMFPDIDSFFGHYTSRNPFVGHRGMTHSILAVIAISLVLTTVIFIILKGLLFLSSLLKTRKEPGDSHTVEADSQQETGRKSILSAKSFLLLFFLNLVAGLSHVVADLFQPAGIWGGIPVFFPLKEGGTWMRHGGWTHTGWYDYHIMWLFIKTALLSGILVITALVAGKIFSVKKLKALLITGVIIINITALYRAGDYLLTSRYPGHYKWEKRQMLYLDRAHPVIKKITLEGRKKFMRIFFKSTR